MGQWTVNWILVHFIIIRFSCDLRQTSCVTFCSSWVFICPRRNKPCDYALHSCLFRSSRPARLLPGPHKLTHVWHALLSFIMSSLFKCNCFFFFQQSIFSDSTPPKICAMHTLQWTYCWSLAFAHSERWLRADRNEATPVVCSAFSFNDPAKRTCVEHGSHL